MDSNSSYCLLSAVLCDIFELLSNRTLWSSWKYLCRRGAVVEGVEHISTNCVSQHLSGEGSKPAGSVGRDLNLQKLNYQCLTTRVAIVLVVR